MFKLHFTSGLINGSVQCDPFDSEKAVGRLLTTAILLKYDVHYIFMALKLYIRLFCATIQTRANEEYSHVILFLSV